MLDLVPLVPAHIEVVGETAQFRTYDQREGLKRGQVMTTASGAVAGAVEGDGGQAERGVAGGRETEVTGDGL